MAKKVAEVKLVSEIIDAVPGVKRAFHVFTPALQYRLENKGSALPVMALRSSNHKYGKMKLYARIETLGPASLDPLFDAPLPGTGVAWQSCSPNSPCGYGIPKARSPR